MTITERFSKIHDGRHYVLKSLIEALALPRQARVLDIGCGGDSGNQTTVYLADYFESVIDGLERLPERAEDVRKNLGNRANVLTIDAAYWGPAEPYDLALLQLHTGGAPESLTLHLEEILPRMVRPDGYALIQLVTRTRIGGAATDQLSGETLELLDHFLEDNFGVLEPSSRAFAEKFAGTGWTLEALVPASPTVLSPAEGAPDQPEHPLDMPLHIRDDGVASWLVLRHQPPPAQGCPWPFVRRQAPAFSTASTIEWLTALRSAGLEFLLPEAYFARLKSRAPGQPAVNPAALLKHDIHHDFRRVVRMAEREAEAGISAVYFMMDHHELNAGFWGLDYTWRELRRIQDMGHQIGLHVDTFELILRYGDLMTGLKVFKQVFEDQGLSIIAANAHGNTKLGKRTGLRPMDFFSGLSRAAPPQPTELEQHVRRYTLGEVGKAGIHYWLDAAIYEDGTEIQRDYYVSDNSSRLQIIGRKGIIESSGVLHLDEDFVQRSLAILPIADSIFLLHPQFYE